METISEHAAGGRHRQDGDGLSASQRDDPRDDRPTDRLPLMATPRSANGSPGRTTGEPAPDGGVEDPNWPDEPDGVPDDQDGDYQDGDYQDGDYQDGDHQDGDHGDDDGEPDSGTDVEPADPLDAAAATSLNGADTSVRVQPEASSPEASSRRSSSRRSSSPRSSSPGSSSPRFLRSRRRRAGHPGRKVLRRVTWVIVWMAVLAGLAGGAAVLFPGLVRDIPTEVPQSVAAPLPSEGTFGQRLDRSDGWAVEVGQPRAVRPNDDVDLPADADRGVLLEVVLTNNGADARDTAGWTVKAIVGGRPVEVLPDAGAPSRTVRPGTSLTFPVVVPMPEDATDLQLETAPEKGTPSLFLGTA